MASLFDARKSALKTQVLLESYHSVDYKVVHLVSAATGNGDVAVADKQGGPDITASSSSRFKEIVRTDESVKPGSDFLESQERISRGTLFKVLQRMPKGALLHTHGIATGPFSEMIRILRADCRVFIYNPKAALSIPIDAKDVEYTLNGIHLGAIRYLSISEAALDDSWVPAKAVSEKDFDRLIQVPCGTPREKKWPLFGNVWMRLRELSDSLPLWRGKGSYFWCMLSKLLETGVTYVEIKQLIPNGWIEPSDDGTSVDRSCSIDDFMSIFCDTVSLFRDEHPEFVGAKMIWCSLKICDPDTIGEQCDTVLRLMKEFPDAIAGYDLVGHEDTLRPIALFQEQLAKFKEQGGRLILHAGETLEPEADQIYDAVALGAERIGHAYSLPKFPALMRLVKERSVTVECCPLSNHCLGYVADLRNHPGLIMLNNGVRLTISSDDAAIFGYDDLTHDFAVITKAWGLTLSQLRHLGRASFKCTALSYTDQARAEQAFDAAWERFLAEFSKM